MMTYLHGTAKAEPFFLECYAAVVPIAINDSQCGMGIAVGDQSA